MSKIVAIDFETYLISPEYPSPKPVCMSYADGHFSDLLVGLPAIEKYLEFLLRSQMTIVAHNMAFEANVIFKWFPDLTTLLQNAIKNNRLVCTKVYEQLTDNVRKKQIKKFSLAALVNHYFGEDVSETKKDPNAWRLRYAELDNTPLSEWPQEAIDYAIDDSIWALKVYNEQLKVKLDITLSVQADIYLNYIGQFGIAVDQNTVEQLERELHGRLDPNYARLEELGICSRHKKTGKIKKNMNVFRGLISRLIPDPIKTPKGAISTASEDLEALYSRPDLPDELKEPISLFLDVMQYEKILTAFVPNIKNTDVVRSQYTACVSSGRTSSSKSSFYQSVNIQQMPREVKGLSVDVRNCFVPRSGYKLCSIDYAGLELASTAFQLWKETGRRSMLDTINGGDEPVDMHSMLAYRIYNLNNNTQLTYSEFVRSKKLPGFKEYRQLAKPINLGFPGGIGYDTMRTLLARDGIHPKLRVIKEARREDELKGEYRQRRGSGQPVRIRRLEFFKYQLVEDELVALKQELFNLYPDLRYFLQGGPRQIGGHYDYRNGETKAVKNEFGEWEQEDMYRFEIDGFTRDYCTYTAFCNGILMQSPAAIGAKKAMVDIISHYQFDNRVNILAFIHDEVVFEVLDTPDQYAIIEDIAARMIIQMQTVMPRVRITVEAETMSRWMKAGGDWSKTYWRDAI